MYKIILEISPSSIFGLPQDGFIVWPKGDFKLKILYDSISNIVFKISKYREYDNAVIIFHKYDNYTIKIDDNFFIFECMASNSRVALDNCQTVANKFIRILQFKYQIFFHYKIKEIYFNNTLVPLPSSGRVEGIDIAFYNLDKLNEALYYSLNKLHLSDAISLRFLDYFDRALFLDNIYSNYSEKHLNDRFYYFLLPEIYLNYYKSLSTIIGDPKIDKDYQKRYRVLGFDKDYFDNIIETLRNIRNNCDISHYSLADNISIYTEILENIPKIKKVSIEVFEKYLLTIENT